jgi:cutinase
MKTVYFILALLSSLAATAPLEIRQSVDITENEYTLGGCRDIIFFFARGSTEIGNLARFPSISAFKYLELIVF